MNMIHARLASTGWLTSLTVAALLAVAGCGGSTGSAHSSRTSVAPTRTPQSSVSGGSRNSVELRANGGVLAWGDNSSGELGDGTTTKRHTPVPVSGLGAGSGVVEVVAGASHALALKVDGRVLAWGHNRSGELGDGSTADHPTPELIGALRNIKSLAAGDGFSLALKADGTVLAWGNNKSGQLGDGNAPADHATPAPVHDLGSGSGVVAIAAGGSHGLVLKRDGTVLAWGNGTSGQLGEGTNGKASAPTRVTGLGSGSGVRAIAAGGSFSLALKADGTVLAWGNNKSGQLGDGSAPIDHNTPTPVSGLGARSGVRAIAAGGSFSLALKADGTVLAWGNNKSGELGDGSAPNDRHTPVQVSGLGPGSTVIGVAAGGAHALALKPDGALLAWGLNSSGQLGDGGAPVNHPTPVSTQLPPDSVR
jgi:alpha-tubulin suppressor-like RCC1 family protein